MKGQRVDFTKSGKPVKHGTNGYAHGCRCVLCRITNRDAHREYMHRTGRARPWVEYQETRDRADHGSQAMYRLHGCRCDKCVEWARTNRAEWRRKHHASPTPAHVHGTKNGYDNWGCRCEPCQDARREYERARRERVSS